MTALHWGLFGPFVAVVAVAVFVGIVLLVRLIRKRGEHDPGAD